MTEKQFISFSGGVESSAMCVLFGNKADAIFADTMFEHKQIYERIDKVEKWVQTFHRKDFKIHKVNAGSLQDYIKDSYFYPNFSARFCTRKFKIEPIDKFLSNAGEVELMIGLNADETDRTGNHGNKANVVYSYPLIENNINRAQCEHILRSVDLYPNFPPYMNRGGCIGCYYKSKKEFTAMALLNPDEFKIVQDLEEVIQDKRSKFFSIKEGIKMSEIKSNAHSILFSPDEIYPAVNDVTSCGVFCNR